MNCPKCQEGTKSSFFQDEDLGYTIDEINEKDQEHQPVGTLAI